MNEPTDLYTLLEQHQENITNLWGGYRDNFPNPHQEKAALRTAAHLTDSPPAPQQPPAADLTVSTTSVRRWRRAVAREFYD